MGFFNSPYILKPINKMAAKALQPGIRSSITRKQLKAIQQRKAAASRSALDVEFKRKCAEVAAKRKRSRQKRKARIRASKCGWFPGKKKMRTGIFAKMHW
ncbi:MAG: hypothetical protein K6G94_11015 [Kiritimatiellae bacterium]|nr:hypothetical protein [Kiritimatiellia bacterium]